MARRRMRRKYGKMRAVSTPREGAWIWQGRAERVSSRWLCYGAQHALKDASESEPDPEAAPSR